MNFGIIIQARTGSKRFPNKILKKINNNYNVLEFLITRILNQFDKKNLLIATTKLKRDRKIINISKKFKINIFLGSEKDVLSRYLNCAQKYKIKNIIRLTSDCPLIDSELIKKMISVYKNNKLDYLSNTLPPNKSKYPDGSDIEIFSLKALKVANKMSKSISDREHVTNLFWKKNKIFKSSLISQKKNLSNYKFSIDYKDELIMIKKIVNILENSNLKGKSSEIVNIIKHNKIFKKISSRNKIKFKKNRKDLYN
tara:strand:+ start:2753 stop:3514 length:762 start_codon:yes stop_codon:yes gene_type:complete